MKVISRLLIAALVVGTGAGITAQTPQQFRGRVDLVRVDVAVSEKNRPVRGLPKSAFTLKDRGVPQNIDALSVEDIPIDVTVVVDMGVVTVAMRHATQFQGAIRHLANRLKRTDRLRVLNNGTYVSELRPVTSAGGFRSGSFLLPLDPRAGASTTDAIAMALMDRAETGRRQLVIALTAGSDFFGVLEFKRVPLLAQHSDALLHVVLAKMYRGGSYGVGFPEFSPYAEDLIRAAEVTGGAWHDYDKNVDSILDDILNDFRSSYVLTYTPQAAAPGWHDVDVALTLPEAAKYSVRARRGYFSQ